MNKTRNITITAMMIALGLVLPPVIRLIPSGGILFSPMHIAPLLCGMVVGPVEGLITGILCPILNNVLFGMPQGTTLIGMCFELPAYGCIVGVMMRLFKNMKPSWRVYLSLIIAMLVGRIVGGITQAILLGGTYTIKMWATAYFLSTSPAILIHLLLIPSVYFALKKAGFINQDK